MRIFEAFFAAVDHPPVWWYRDSEMTKFTAAKQPGVDLMRALVEGPHFTAPGSVGLTLHAGPAADAPQTPSISFYSTDTSGLNQADAETTAFVRLCLPPSAHPEGRERFELAWQCASALPLQCGHAGYSWYWNPGDTRMARAMAQSGALLMQHGAMLYHEPFAFNALSGPYLYQIGWLTLLGADLTSRLGGAAALQFQPDDRVGVAHLPEHGGVVLAAGEEPQTGGPVADAGVELQPYRAIGRALASLRLPDSDLEFLDLTGFDDEIAVQNWYLRFFDPQEAPER